MCLFVPGRGLPRLRCSPRFDWWLTDQLADREEQVKSYEEIMEILEAYDLTGSLWAAAELAGCSHHTVDRPVKRRDAGLLPGRDRKVERSKLVDRFLPQVEEWVERSGGKIRADVVFDKF